MAPSDADKPTSHMPPASRRPRDAYGDPDAATRRMTPQGGNAGADGATAYVGRKRAPKPDEASDPNLVERPPVTGWLVVTDGPGKGRSVELFEGRNLVGRGDECEAKLDFGDGAISRTYSFVIRYTSSTKRFKIAPNIAVKNPVKLNGEEFDDTTDLRAGDQIVLGATQLRFVALCGDGFDWADLEKAAG